MTWVLDLDGVVWHGQHLIEGSAEAIATLQNKGVRVAYVTNNSTLGARPLVEKFAEFGIDVDVDDIISAHDLLVERIGSGKRVLATAAPGLVEALRAAGNEVFIPEDFVEDWQAPETIATPPDVDLVVGGQKFTLNYATMSVAVRALLQCRQLYAANRDPLYPGSTGMTLGTGSILAALETAAGVQATVFGKPERPMVEALHQRFPDVRLVVGDQLATDGLLAHRAKVPFGYVLSGVDAQRRSASGDVPYAFQAADLAGLVEVAL
jgi:4-nitrophenyl phosphatase